MMSTQAQTRRTMSNALPLLEDLMESIDGEQKACLSQTMAELEAIENNLEENDEEVASLRDTPHNTDSPILEPARSMVANLPHCTVDSSLLNIVLQD
jgi:hypothetical protein